MLKKNILVLTGSPRKGGNSDRLADAFIAGVKQAGHTVVKYATADKQIKGCRACQACFSKDTACVFADDFNELAPLVENADMLVIATPLYCFTFPAQLKAAIDKFFSFMVGQRTLKIKECALLASAGDPREVVFDGLVASYKMMADHMNWNDSGTILVPGLMGKDDILKTDGLKRAGELGKRI